MALLFSRARVSAPDGNEAEFLVKGIPRDYDDLENYTAFEEFLGELDEETEISVHAEAYLYLMTVRNTWIPMELRLITPMPINMRKIWKTRESAGNPLTSKF